ncbi:TPA: hypothetical protein P0N90_004292 [Yersinia enterocolitica]|nr:hypothetical protein [Yersinia enterocolitica]HDL7792710.1 hypothetical protein [Yersinia enterocolitica]HDM8376468.1 hypothetical protein [Yersinia enterocolitica]HEN5460190.1 hypothetical protein [Yersinia enterocolitica]
MSGLIIFEAGYGSGVNTYQCADRIPFTVLLWWWEIRRRRFTGVPLVSPHIGACIHHIRLSTNHCCSNVWNRLGYEPVIQ